MASLAVGSAGRRKKIALLAALALVVSASLLGYRYLTQPSPRTPVTVGTASSSNAYWPIYIAEDSGIFQKYGLNVSIVALGGGNDVITSLAARQIQIGDATTDAVVAAKLEGLDVVQVGAAETQRPLYLVTCHGITSPQQLRGKVGGVITVGGGLVYFATVIMLRQLGLDPMKDVTLIGISGGPIALLAALQAGKADFTVTTQPLKAKELGMNVLFYVPDVVQLIPGNAYVTSTKYLKENREIVKQFMKAVTEATRFFFQNKEESKRILSKWLMENDPEVLEQQYQDWSKVALRIPANSLDQLRKVLEAMAPFTPKATDADPRIFVDNSIIEELDDEGFFKTIWG